jgi:hypothetical protein
MQAKESVNSKSNDEDSGSEEVEEREREDTGINNESNNNQYSELE